MTAKERNNILLKDATKAMRSAVRKVVADRKMRKQPLLVWKDGKVVKLSLNDKKA